MPRGLSSPMQARITGLFVLVVEPNVIVGGFSVCVDSPTGVCFTALDPVRVMPENRSTVRPPPVSPVLVAVKVVEDALPISEFRMDTHNAQAVPPPVESGAVAVPHRV